MDSYTYVPEVEFEKWREALQGISPVYSKISYGIANFYCFRVQEVYVNDKQKGEYHIHLNGRHDLIAMRKYANFFAENLKGCEVGVLDPDNTLGLEYHLYVIAKDPLRIMGMMSTMETLNDILIKGTAQ